MIDFVRKCAEKIVLRCIALSCVVLRCVAFSRKKKKQHNSLESHIVVKQCREENAFNVDEVIEQCIRKEMIEKLENVYLSRYFFRYVSQYTFIGYPRYLLGLFKYILERR